MDQVSRSKTDKLEIIEAQIRELFGRVTYTHKTHEKCADIRLKQSSQLKLTQITLSALTTTGLIVTIFGDPAVSKVSAVISGVLSAILFIVNTYTKDVDCGKLSEQHKITASELWNIRESYLSLLTDIKTGEIMIDDVRDKRDKLQK